MLIRELLNVIHEGLDSTEEINLDSPIAFILGNPKNELNLHLSEGGVAAATNRETGKREDILYLSFVPNDPDIQEVKDLLSDLLGKGSLKHMKSGVAMSRNLLFNHDIQLKEMLS